MRKPFTLNQAFVFFSLLFVSNMANCHTRCDQISLDTIDQLDVYIQEIEKKDDQYTKSLSEDDLIHRLIDLRPSEFKKLFSECVTPILERYNLKNIKPEQLDKLFKAIQTIAFYSEAPEHAKTLHTILKETLKRNDIENTHNWPSTVYKSYIKARLFKQAKQLIGHFPQYTFEKLPKFEDQYKKSDSISLMQLHDNGKTLVRNPFLIPSRGHIIVVGHPFCHFSRNALSTINSDPELTSIFINHSTWIMPSKGSLDIDGVLEANNNAPIKYHYIYLKSEWPEIDYWGTPTFYFYKNGKVLRKVIGWPQEGRKQEILKALQLIGLTTASTNDKETTLSN